jgi:threonine dehydrogenase-like Zn-dependent dehydrogenase
MKVPARALVPMPDELSFEAGAAISCGTGTSYAALHRMKLNGGDTIAIFGQGPVGLAATQIATAMGARVIALDLSAERLTKARTLGAETTINPSSEEPIAAIRALNRGKGADLALEAAGSAQARIAAIRSTRIWGTVCFVGAGGQVTINVGLDLMQRQLTVFGSWTFSTAGQAECARSAVDSKVAVDAIFTHRWKREDAAEAYRLADGQNSGKGVILS